MAIERRRVVRLHPQADLLVIFDCNQLVIGRIHTISPLGVSVEYEDGLCRPPIDRDILVRIMDERTQAVPIHALHCTPVYDIPTLSHRQSFKGRPMRLSGMHFTQIDSADQQRIDLLLQSSRP